jgi:hypothetical protein
MMAGRAQHGRFAFRPAWGKRRLAITKTVMMSSGKLKTMVLHATRGWKWS